MHAAISEKTAPEVPSLGDRRGHLQTRDRHTFEVALILPQSETLVHNARPDRYLAQIDTAIERRREQYHPLDIADPIRDELCQHRADPLAQHDEPRPT